jgi:hypothetical protein
MYIVRRKRWNSLWHDRSDRKDLENGITLTPGTELKVYKSSIDATADR